MTQERRRRRKDAIINNFTFQSAYLSRMNKKELQRKNGAGAQIISNCFAFFCFYHEMLPIITKRIN